MKLNFPKLSFIIHIGIISLIDSKLTAYVTTFRCAHFFLYSFSVTVFKKKKKKKKAYGNLTSDKGTAYPEVS